MKLFAYIDPGTGSFVLQAVVGSVVGVSYALRHRIGAVVSKLKSKPTEEMDAGQQDQD